MCLVLNLSDKLFDSSCTIFSRSLILVILIVVLALLPRVATAESSRVAVEIEKILEQSSSTYSDSSLEWDRLRKFYSSRDYRQVWGDRYGPSLRAQKLRHVIRNADREGLDPVDYHVAEIDEHWTTLSATELARLDLLMTDAFFLYSIDVHRGRYEPIEVDPIWNIDIPSVDPISLLESTLSAEDFSDALHDLPPHHVGYRWLRDALLKYRRIEQQGGWPKINSDTKLEYGQTHPAVAVLRQRLLAEGDLTLRPVRSAEYFDQALKYAVERFQVRHGLEMDGIVGAETREALNVPVSTRVEQIKLNMNRWRWMPRELGDNYLLVNTAGFELLVFEKDEAAFGMAVITGTPERPTPVIRGTLHTVVLNPDWTVPRTIALQDLLPQQQRNPGFFSSRGIRVYYHGNEIDPAGIDWRALHKNNFPYVLRQDPGPQNALGKIKFLFFNRFSVYLHDTPSKRLFDQSARAYSSGCIRVQEPFKLASYLLREQPEWDEKHIRKVIRSGETQSIAIQQSVPVYLVYLTAWVSTDGTISFYKDVYDLDELNPSFCVSNP